MVLKSFLDVKSYKNVVRWANLIDERPAVKRGRIVNKISGNLSEQLHERHSSKDFDDKTEDKLKINSIIFLFPDQLYIFYAM